MVSALDDRARFPPPVAKDYDAQSREERTARRRKVSRAHVLTALSAIKPGDYMVHADHGIGQYHGLKHIVAGGTEGDFIHLEYAGGDRYSRRHRDDSSGCRVDPFRGRDREGRCRMRRLLFDGSRGG